MSSFLHVCICVGSIITSIISLILILVLSGEIKLGKRHASTIYPHKNTTINPHKNTIVSGKEFLDLFSVFPKSEDPTGGFVDYFAYKTIDNNPLIYYDTHSVVLGVATASMPTSAQSLGIEPNIKIPSVRLYTQNTVFNGGLFSIELFNIPSGPGVWPAIWFSQDPSQMLPNSVPGVWPANGEIDWIENVNFADFTQSTLHIDGWTSKGLCPWACQSNVNDFCSGQGCMCPGTCKNQCGSSECPWICQPVIIAPFGQGQRTDRHCSTFGKNYGCSVKAPQGSFGDVFNEKNKGSVFSMEWNSLDSEGFHFIIKFWYITNKDLIKNEEFGPFSSTPDSSQWGDPYGVFDNSNANSKCRLKNLQLIINITLCGMWAGALIKNCNTNLFSPNALKNAFFHIGRFAYMT